MDVESIVRKVILAEQMNKKRSANEEQHASDSASKVQRVGDDFADVKARGDVKSFGADKVDKRAGKKVPKEDTKYPVEPRVISVIKQPRTVMNHSYRDFSKVPADLTFEKTNKIEEMTFSEKVHNILSIKEYKPVISWMTHGRSFRVIIPKIFEEQICTKYFGHSRYSSFLRLLNNHGFKHITQGTDRNCYYHECFLRDMPHLCQFMPKPKNARHLIPDPTNEPDFYHLSKLYPLNDQSEVGDEIVVPASVKGQAVPTKAAKPQDAAKKHAAKPVEASAPTSRSFSKVNRKSSPIASVASLTKPSPVPSAVALPPASLDPNLQQGSAASVLSPSLHAIQQGSSASVLSPSLRAIQQGSSASMFSPSLQAIHQGSSASVLSPRLQAIQQGSSASVLNPNLNSLQQASALYCPSSSSLGGYTANTLLQHRRLLLEHAAAMEGNAVLDRTALLEAALRGQLNVRGPFGGGFPF